VKGGGRRAGGAAGGGLLRLAGVAVSWLRSDRAGLGPPPGSPRAPPSQPLHAGVPRERGAEGASELAG